MMQLPKYKRIAYDERTLSTRIKEMGKQISVDYAGKELVLVSVLKGTLYFFADLTRAIELPVMLDFMGIGVYPHATDQTGAVRITKDLDIDISGKHVLVVEDIIRTGLTTGYLVQNLETRNPASVKVCALLVNSERQLIDVPMAYCGFNVPDTWLVGYGMDVGEKWRNIPYVLEVDRADL